MKQTMFNLSSLLMIAFLAMSLINPIDGYEVGDVATDFKLENVDGKMVSLSDYPDAKGYIVIFTCNTCPYAQMYEDRINKLNKKYEPQGYPVIAIMPNDTEMKPGDSMDKMKERAETKGFTFPYLIDAEQTIFPQYGASKTPHVYLLNKERVVKYIGAIDDNPQSAENAKEKYVENAIAALESGKNPDPSMTKAIGCGIKARKAN
jgi:peroxiredoxin